MKILKNENFSYPIMEGNDEEFRDWAVSLLGNTISENGAYIPSEAFLVFERMVNSKFTQSPVEAIHEDLKTLNARINHIEASQGAVGLRDGRNKTKSARGG